MNGFLYRTIAIVTLFFILRGLGAGSGLPTLLAAAFLVTVPYIAYLYFKRRPTL